MDLYLQERHKRILDVLAERERVSVAELSLMFGVSEVTVRSDLQTLAEANLLIRTRGGALQTRYGLQDLSLTLRLQRQMNEKRRIAQAAAEQVHDGDAVFLDSSSTALAMTPFLKKRRYLTVVTNGLAVAQEFLEAEGVTVLMPGGKLRRDTASLVQFDPPEGLRRLNLQYGFFGAHGLTLADGLTDVSVEEAEIKQRMVSLCRQAAALVDGTKWGKVGLARFAETAEISLVITDADAPAEWVDPVAGAGIAVTRV